VICGQRLTGDVIVDNGDEAFKHPMPSGHAKRRVQQKKIGTAFRSFLLDFRSRQSNIEAIEHRIVKEITHRQNEKKPKDNQSRP